MRILPSALRHGISGEEIEEVVAYGIPVEIPPGPGRETRVMFVGWTYEAVLVEVGVEYLHGGEETAFHAVKATKYYAKKAGL